MARITGRLTPRQFGFVERLAQGMSPVEAGRAAGISERSVRRYMSDPKVKHALAEIQAQTWGQVARRLQSRAGDMLEVLSSLGRDADCPPTVRLRACTAWLELALKATELAELAQRIADLEERVNEPPPAGRGVS